MENSLKLQLLLQKTSGLSDIETLLYCLDKFRDKIALSSSLCVEDQVLTDIILRHTHEGRIFTLDTGRLHPETYQLIEKTNLHYNYKLEIYFPQSDAVETLTRTKGLFSFYASIENRKDCCAIRKLEPLSRALKGLDVWITGIRKEQAITRKDMAMIEWDERRRILKLNPLIYWSESQVWDYINMHKVPYNTLHDIGFSSIGCEPCTRAVKTGENIRSGRWWWEHSEHKECGLHT